MRSRLLLMALGLWLLAAAQRSWIAPQLTQLPADYAEETSYAAKFRFRETPTGASDRFDLTGRRVDQTLVTSAGHAIVQGDLHWTTQSGQVAFETTGVYGVTRDSRMNLPGYGDVSRGGQFLFPPHTERRTYRYWDPMFVGPRVATFEGDHRVDGLPVYVFRFAGRGMDETAGFSHLPDVPERYHAYTDGQGTMWIEPTSGTIVDYEESGISYFVEPATGKRIADLNIWSARYTPRTKAAKWRQAVAARRRILALEVWLPMGLLLAGFVALAAVGLRPRRQRTQPPPAPDDRQLASVAGESP